MSEKDVKLFSQLSAVQYMLQRLYLIMYAKEGVSLDAARRPGALRREAGAFLLGLGSSFPPCLE